mgnify:CR=1 FL=1
MSDADPAIGEAWTRHVIGSIGGWGKDVETADYDGDGRMDVAVRATGPVVEDFAAAFEKVDVLISPTAPTTAFRMGEKLDDPLAMYLNDVTTIPANLAGVPGMGLPIGLAPEDGLPVGFQIMAPAREDARLYSLGATLERLLEDAWGHTLLSQAPQL